MGAVGVVMIELIVLGLFSFSMLSIYIGYYLAKKRVNELGDFLLQHIDKKDDPIGYVSVADYSLDLDRIQQEIDRLSERISALKSQ